MISTYPVRRSARGFTLIELLVVIAIIAILAAILFPVFAQARSKARQASGLSNIKQMGLAILMYTQDYDEKFPRAGWECQKAGDDKTMPAGSRNACAGTAWQNIVQPYVKNGGLVVSPGDGSGGANEDGGATIDGAFSILINDLLSHQPTTLNADGSFDVGNNQNHFSDGLSQAAVVAPSDCVMLAEGTCGWQKVLDGTQPAENTAWNGATNTLSKWMREQTISGMQTFQIAGSPHQSTGWGQRRVGNPWYNNGMNFCFSDGHAKWFKTSDSQGYAIMCGTLPWRKHLDPGQRGFTAAWQATACQTANIGGTLGNWD